MANGHPTTTSPARTAALRVPGAALHYEVRGHGPLVALVGAPMAAAAFEPAADLLAADHTVLTTDPRGIGRSPLDDPDQDSTPELRADDLAEILRHVDAGPAVVLGSSGGAVTALALAQAHPDLVRAVVAHEAPFYDLLPDREERYRAVERMIATYASGDVRGAWEQFLDTADVTLPPEVLDSMVGGDRDPREVADERYQFHHMLRGTVHWQPDLDALRDGPVRVVVGIGEESTGELCDRVSRALGTALGVMPVVFPGGHLGFVEQPEPFVARLRTVLAG